MSPTLKLVVQIFRLAIRDNIRILSLIHITARESGEAVVHAIVDNHFMVPPPRSLYPGIHRVLKIFATTARELNTLGRFEHKTLQGVRIEEKGEERWNIYFHHKPHEILEKEFLELLDIAVPKAEAALEKLKA